jgi:hypothetical protein
VDRFVRRYLRGFDWNRVVISYSFDLDASSGEMILIGRGRGVELMISRACSVFSEFSWSKKLSSVSISLLIQ